jgi:hypothetical protein
VVLRHPLAAQNAGGTGVPFLDADFHLDFPYIFYMTT